MSKHSEQAAKPWWEKLTEASADESKGKSLIVKVIVVAIVFMGALIVWDLVKDSSKSDEAELSDILFRAAVFLPDGIQGRFGRIPDLEYQGRETMADAFYRHYETNTFGRENPLSAIKDREAAERYLSDVQIAIEELKDKRDKFTEDAWAVKYLHTLQQLHYYASINSADPAQRMKHLDAQLAVLKELEGKYAGQGIPSLVPFSESGKTVLQLWRETAENDKKGLEQLNLGGAIEVKPDANVVVTIELDNGSILKMNTYSEVSPKAVQNFLTLARSGFYDGIAVHRLDPAGVLELGSPWSREAPERKFLWGREVPGYSLPLEGTSLLPVKRGSVSIKLNGTNGHGIFFEIHVSEPDRVRPGHTVIGEITEGLDALESWTQTEVHDEVGVADRLLPRTRLGVKKITVEGEVDHKSLDSWKPTPKELKVPEEVNGLEKQFEEALKASAPTDDAEETETGEGETQPEDGDEDK